MTYLDRMARRVVICGAGLVALAVFCRLALAQVDVSANLVGTVTDTSSAVVPGAKVTVRNQQTGLELRTSSDERGDFSFPSLPTGNFTVTCEAAGFKKFVSSDIVLQARKTTTLAVSLEVGAITESVEVTAAAAMVDTASSSIQTTYDEKLMTSLPVWGRDPRISMELLMPGAVAAGTGASYNVPVTSFNGVSGLTNNYRIDGSDVNDYFHGSASTYPPPENMAEFSVNTSLPDASVARGAGGQIETVMKSGTNTLHGQAWGYFQSGDWNANNWENNWAGVPRPPLSQRWYGGNAGGPLIIPRLYNGRNRTFFFSSYEGTSTSLTTTFTGQTITNAERAGDFTSSPNGIPVVDGVPMPIIPKSRFTKMGSFIAGNTQLLPAPTSGLTTYSWQPTQKQQVKTFIGKIDHYFNSKHRLFGSLWWSRDVANADSLAMAVFAGARNYWGYPNPKLLWTYSKLLQSWTVNDTYTISPSMLNNVIFGVRRLGIPLENTYSPTNTLFTAADMGVGSVGDWYAPDVQRVSMPRIFNFGIYNGYISQLPQNSVYIADNFIITHGRHTWKMGLELRQYHEKQDQTFTSGGNYGFADGRQTYGGSRNGIADMLIGAGVSFTQNNDQNIDTQYPAREAYVQDSIKASPRLTLMFGARWQPHFGVSPAHGEFVTFRAGQSSTIYPTAPVGLVTVGDRGVPSNLYGVRWGNIGPRASFAWDIFGNGKAALRGGYAWTTDYQTLLAFNSYTRTPPYGVSYSPPTGYPDLLARPYVASYGNSMPFPFKPPLAGDPRNSTLVFPNPVNTIGMDGRYNSGQIHQWNATLDFEPLKSYLISVGYVATRGTHLQENHDVNWPRFVPGASANTTANINNRRPYFPVGFQTITMYVADFNSMYNSMQARFTKRYSYGLTFMGHYTLSSNRTQHGCRYWDNCGLDYFSPGLMSRLAMAFAYDLPIRGGPRGVSKALLGGWTVGGTVTGSSGEYGGIGDFNCAEFNAGSAGCQATYVGTDPYSTNRGKPVLQGNAQVGIAWLNPASFVRANQVLVNGVPTTTPGVGQRLFLGNAIQGVHKGPAAFMLNASLVKNFAIGERFKLNYRIEAFNALNHTVLNGAGGTVGPDMSRFGVISSAWDPRKIQMSARIIF